MSERPLHHVTPFYLHYMQTQLQVEIGEEDKREEENKTKRSKKVSRQNRENVKEGERQKCVLYVVTL